MSEPVYASRSVGKPYACQYPWPCAVQCGDHGVVFATPSYTTAFFEAFPQTPPTFIRGEGATVALAEREAWQQWERIQACPGHVFDRRGYTSGAGVCIRCGLFQSRVFLPAYTCVFCGTATDYTVDQLGRHYCEQCEREKPLDQWTELDWRMAYFWNDFIAGGSRGGEEDGSL